MTDCDNCGSQKTEYHEKSNSVICRTCRHCYAVKDGEWLVSGPEATAWERLSSFQSRQNLTI